MSAQACSSDRQTDARRSHAPPAELAQQRPDQQHSQPWTLEPVAPGAAAQQCLHHDEICSRGDLVSRRLARYRQHGAARSQYERPSPSHPPSLPAKTTLVCRPGLIVRYSDGGRETLILPPRTVTTARSSRSPPWRSMTSDTSTMRRSAGKFTVRPRRPWPACHPQSPHARRQCKQECPPAPGRGSRRSPSRRSWPKDVSRRLASRRQEAPREGCRLRHRLRRASPARRAAIRRIWLFVRRRGRRRPREAVPRSPRPRPAL